MTLRSTIFTVLLLTCASACAPTTAVVDGQRLTRPTLAYTDHRYFAVRHTNAYPDAHGPSSGAHSYGGRLKGRVCAVDLELESEYWGHRLDVSGHALPAIPGPRAQPLPVRFDIHDGRDGRTILGTIGHKVYPIEIHLHRDALHARIGWKRFTLEHLDVDHDELQGTVHFVNWQGRDMDEPFTIRGMSRLWSMPAVDQAAVLPCMMTCLSDLPGPDRDIEPLAGIDFTGGDS
jgi:hypothetical protein